MTIDTTPETTCSHPQTSLRYFSNTASPLSSLAVCLKCGLWQRLWKEGNQTRTETLGGRLHNREEFIVPARVIMAMVYENPTD